MSSQTKQEMNGRRAGGRVTPEPEECPQVESVGPIRALVALSYSLFVPLSDSMSAMTDWLRLLARQIYNPTLFASLLLCMSSFSHAVLVFALHAFL